MQILMKFKNKYNVFFENNIPNLENAKKYGVITFLITEKLFKYF
jgi:hypothetical protein